MSSASRPRSFSRLRRLRALATANWLARSYLAVFAASVLVTLLFPDSGFAPAPVFLTAPLSLMSVVLPFGPGTEGSLAVEVLATGLWFAWLLLCALVNAATLGSLAARHGATAPAGAPRPRSLSSLLAPAVDNGLARAYLAVVAASLGTFLYAVYLSPDPGFAAIWPFITTAPLSILALSAPVESLSPSWLGTLVFSVGVALSGLVNATLLGRLAHTLRTREARR